jgi:hypothetical protein
MIRITRTATRVTGTEADFACLRAAFDRDHHVLLPQLVDADLLEAMRQRLERGEFYERVHAGIGDNKELCLRAGTFAGAWYLLFNGQRLFELIQKITGCPRIGSFFGRVYRRLPSRDHCDAWHDDAIEHRMVALSLNLSPEPYVGGLLQIRDARRHTLLHEVANTGFGDALIFRIDPGLEHRVTSVEGTVPKTAFAGWFRSQPDFLPWVRGFADPT